MVIFWHLGSSGFPRENRESGCSRDDHVGTNNRKKSIRSLPRISSAPVLPAESARLEAIKSEGAGCGDEASGLDDAQDRRDQGRENQRDVASNCHLRHRKRAGPGIFPASVRDVASGRRNGSERIGITDKPHSLTSSSEARFNLRLGCKRSFDW
jgi:hypothetical protein